MWGKIHPIGVLKYHVNINNKNIVLNYGSTLLVVRDICIKYRQMNLNGHMAHVQPARVPSYSVQQVATHCRHLKSLIISLILIAFWSNEPWLLWLGRCYKLRERDTASKWSFNCNLRSVLIRKSVASHLNRWTLSKFQPFRLLKLDTELFFFLLIISPRFISHEGN